jgi:hypothetical protein
MVRGVRWLLAAAAVTLLSVSTALAAPTTSGEVDWTVTMPAPAGVTALQPATVEAGTATLQLRPVQIARVPGYGLTNSTLFSTGSQAVGFQTGRSNAWGNRHVQWAVYGAAIGAIIGLIDEDPFQNALIGGAIGFGLSFIVGR